MALFWSCRQRVIENLVYLGSRNYWKLRWLSTKYAEVLIVLWHTIYEREAFLTLKEFVIGINIRQNLQLKVSLVEVYEGFIVCCSLSFDHTVLQDLKRFFHFLVLLYRPALGIGGVYEHHSSSIFPFLFTFFFFLFTFFYLIFVDLLII